MNIMNRLTWRSMVKNRTRTIVTAVGIALSAALFTAVITLGASVLHYLIDLQIFKGGDYHAYSTVVLPEDAEAVRENDRAVYTAEAQILGKVEMPELNLGFYTAVVKACTPEYLEMIPGGLDLISGRLPEAPGEIVIDEVLRSALETAGVQVELGREISLKVLPQMAINSDETLINPDYLVDEDENDDTPEILVSYELTGILVGITDADDRRGDLPGETNWNYVHVFADPALPAPLYHNFYLRAQNIGQAEALAAEINGKVNYELLQYYGISASSTVTFVLLSLVAAVVVITFLCAVSLISNSFSISTVQRTRELGLLASVGATRKQLRRSILFEALLLCLIGIPLGLALGLGAAFLAVYYLGDGAVSLMAAQATGLQVGLLISPWSLLLAAAVSAATVFLSAWLPSRRAEKVSPIEAIRQHQDYKTPKRIPQISGFGRKTKLPALMARKYFHTSRGSYLPIMLSLGISVALLLSANAATRGIQTYADSVDLTQNCHFTVKIHEGGMELAEELRNHPATKQSVVYRRQNEKPVVMDSQISEERINAGKGLADWVWPAFETKSRKDMTAWIYYLEDEDFNSFLLGLDILPAPYYSQTDPRGVVFLQRSRISTSIEDVAEEYRDHMVDGKYVDEFPLFADHVETVSMQDEEPALLEYMARQMEDTECVGFWKRASGYDYLEDGQLIWWAWIHPMEERMDAETGERTLHNIDHGTIFRFLVQEETNAAGESVSRFYFYDKNPSDRKGSVLWYFSGYESSILEYVSKPMGGFSDTGDRETPWLAEVSSALYEMGIGDTVAKIPYGLWQSVREYIDMTMVRPASVIPEDAETELFVSLDTNDYGATRLLLDKLAAEEKIGYLDFVEEQFLAMQVRDMVDGFCYVFVVLMTVIATGNVFNTVSTNILLRRRDFGILRSVGMSRGSIRAMVAAESLHCGIRSLLVSVPLGLAVGYYITTVIQQTVAHHAYAFPWTTLLAAVGSVLLVMLVSMLYALQRVRNDNPIDAIRMDNM